MSESKRLIDELRELDAQFSFPGTCGEAAAELTRLRAENDALRAVLARIGDLDKRHAIARQCGLNEWADWAQNIARYAARAAIAKATGGNDE